MDTSKPTTRDSRRLRPASGADTQDLDKMQAELVSKMQEMFDEFQLYLKRLEAVSKKRQRMGVARRDDAKVQDILKKIKDIPQG